MKIFLTADLHIGRSYQKESAAVAEAFTSARIRALARAVDIANREGCRIFVIAGDLYDRVSGIPKALHKQVCACLEEFTGPVLVLPGNHDYYDPEQDRLWKDFESVSGSHIRVFKEQEAYEAEGAVFYPCLCRSKHSKENALGWLRELPGQTPELPERDPQRIHIGLAHGAIEGKSLDEHRDYYYMTPEELQYLGMDAWFVGHTHVRFAIDGRIFSPGTHQQTDVADNSLGEAYIISFGPGKEPVAQAVRTGVLDFTERHVRLEPGQELAGAIGFPELDRERTALRIKLSGTASTEDYEARAGIYEQAGAGYVSFQVDDSGLHKAITPDMINTETLEGSAINRLLMTYSGDEELLGLAFELVRSCREAEAQSGGKGGRQG